CRPSPWQRAKWRPSPGAAPVPLFLWRLDLPESEPEIRCAEPGVRPDLPRLLLHGALGNERFNHNPKVIFQSAPQVQGFGKKQSGIDSENRQGDSSSNR